MQLADVTAELSKGHAAQKAYATARRASEIGGSAMSGEVPSCGAQSTQMEPCRYVTPVTIFG
jgi:hypothetical protein